MSINILLSQVFFQLSVKPSKTLNLTIVLNHYSLKHEEVKYSLP